MSLRLATLAIALLTSGVALCAPALEVYGGLPEVELMQLAPSGDRYALIAAVGETRRLLVVSRDGKVLSTAETGAAKVRRVNWAGENHLLVDINSTFRAPLMFRQDHEFSAVVNIDVVNHGAKPIFDHVRSVADAVFGDYGSALVNGHQFGFFGGITLERSGSGEYILTHGAPDLYRVDLDTMETTRIAPSLGIARRWVVANDGTVLAHSEYLREEGKWRLFPGTNHRTALLERVDPQGQIRVAGLGRSPGTVLVTDDSGDKDLTEEVSIADGRTQQLFGSSTVQHFLRDRDSNQLIGASTQEEPGATFFDPMLQAKYQLARKAFPGLNFELVSLSRHMDWMIVKTDGKKDSGTYWLVDIGSAKARAIARPYPQVKSADVGETRRFNYTAADGLPIEAILTLPPGREARNLPLVVMPHGGPIGVRDEVGFDWWAQAYASRGYAVLQPNYRGSSGYGKAFQQAGYGQWGRKMQTDLSDGIAALAKDGTIDPKRACIVGASYGGYAALAGVTLQQGIYRCAVAVAGPANLRTFFDWQTERYGYISDATRYWRALVGTEKDGDAVMSALSPALSAARADAPVLLIHGRDDTVVPIEQSESMATALKRAGKPYDYVVMEGEDHWLSREKTRIEMLRAAVAFVGKYNPADDR